VRLWFLGTRGEIDSRSERHGMHSLLLSGGRGRALRAIVEGSALLAFGAARESGRACRSAG
jgi:hypothetical protein